MSPLLAVLPVSSGICCGEITVFLASSTAAGRRTQPGMQAHRRWSLAAVLGVGKQGLNRGKIGRLSPENRAWHAARQRLNTHECNLCSSRGAPGSTGRYRGLHRHPPPSGTALPSPPAPGTVHPSSSMPAALRGRRGPTRTRLDGSN
ncbi:uncharacterized protein ACIBXB_021793 [Morphnus guianensis]